MYSSLAPLPSMIRCARTAYKSCRIFTVADIFHFTTRSEPLGGSRESLIKLPNDVLAACRPVPAHNAISPMS